MTEACCLINFRYLCILQKKIYYLEPEFDIEALHDRFLVCLLDDFVHYWVSNCSVFLQFLFVSLQEFSEADFQPT